MSNVVVLTRNYMYWGETDLHDALTKFVKGKVEVVRADESRLVQAGINREGVVLKMPAPLVIRLLDFAGIFVKNSEIKYSKEAVWERDKNFCQFIHRDAKGKKFWYKCNSEDRTIDHLMPKSRGGALNSFLNCVTACRNCNEKIKGNKTPLEAGLVLHKLPSIPKRRKGDMVVLTFTFNPGSKAHQALKELLPDITN